MIKYTAKVLLLVLIISASAFSQYLSEKSYEPNKIVVKLKSNAVLAKSNGNVSISSTLSNFLNAYNVTKISPRFISKNPDNPLSDIVSINFSSNIDPLVLSKKISELEGVVWAEPDFIYKPFHIPNDTSYSKQWNLKKIMAEQGWDISTGDTSIIIGIVDTGVDWDHPDLANNIWTNPGEIPANGVDDDHNGFIDDVHGWDFGGLTGTPDNNPMEDRSDHGTHVAGIASAITDNTTGIASIGYKCKLMPVKASRDNNRNSAGDVSLNYTLDASMYAIENGADIINCSFGNYNFSNAGKEMVDYAISKGVLIVAAAGNDANTLPSYPASYDGVLSVASTNQDDIISSFSNYGSTVDVSAPGENIYSTWMNNTYEYLNGTSMSTPLVAGLAGLVKAKYPGYTPLQIAEQIRANCDNIDAINSSRYAYYIGSGRVNAFKALNNSDSKSVRAFIVSYSDKKPAGNGNDVFEPGEVITVHLKFRNYLSPVQNLTISIQSGDASTSTDNQSFTAGGLGTLDSSECEFQFTVSTDASISTESKLVLKFTDGSYTDYQPIKVIVNPPYYVEKTGVIDMTLTNKGTYGFYDYPDNTIGTGFQYKGGNNVLFEGALVMGNKNNISDAARGADEAKQNTDFQFTKRIPWHVPGELSDHQGLIIFNDNGALFKRFKVDIYQYSHSYEGDPLNKFIVLRYLIKNNNTTDLDSLFIGLFLDWDIVDGSNDIADYNTTNNFGYVYHEGSTGIATASALLSSDKYGYYAIKNDGTDTGFGVYDGFTDAEKLQALSGGISKKKAGTGDVSQLISGGPFNIPVGDSIVVGFALAASENVDDLSAIIQSARDKFLTITDVKQNAGMRVEKFNLEQNYPNPFNPATKIKYSINNEQPVAVQLKVYDILGNTVATLVDENKSAGQYSVTLNASGLASGIYFYELKAGAQISTKKMMFIK